MAPQFQQSVAPASAAQSAQPGAGNAVVNVLGHSAFTGFLTLVSVVGMLFPGQPLLLWVSYIAASLLAAALPITAWRLARQSRHWWYAVAMAVLVGVALGVGFLARMHLFGQATAQPATPIILASSRFDDSTEDWTVVGVVKPVEYQSAGGRVGGYIRAEDGGKGADWFWKAPVKFTGDQSVAYDGTLRYSLYQSDTTTPYSGTIDIILTGANLRLTYDISNPLEGWTSYAIPLYERAGWVKPDGQAPTQAEMERVLSSLQSLEIRGEYRSGVDVGGLDEVSLERRP